MSPEQIPVNFPSIPETTSIDRDSEHSAAADN